MAQNGFSKQLLISLDAGIAFLSRSGVSESFLRFAVVGTMGFCWDTGTVYTFKGLTGLYIAGTLGFFVAATANWALNRIWTFRDQTHIPPHLQWIKFLAANFIGFIFNRGTFFVLISISTLCRNQPVLPIIAGSAAGLYFNYFLSKRLVFS